VARVDLTGFLSVQLFKKRLVISANLLLFVGAALVLLISLLCLVSTIVFGEWNSSATLYWFTFFTHDYDNLMGSLFVAGMIVAIVFVIVVCVTWLLREDTRFNRIGASAVILLLLAWTLMVGSYFVRFFQFGPFSASENLQTVNLGDRIYHLLHFTYDATESHYYWFYECDRFDLFCQKLASHLPLGCETRPCDDRKFLIVDLASKSISFQSYGKIVYTRHVP
jgi:hypothetical protein